jgi:hypothetical protein
MMNDNSDGRRSHLRLRLRRRRAAVVITVIAIAVALLAAACGSGSQSPNGSGGAPDAGGSGTSQQALAYSRCMRSHGVQKYPDASGSNALPSGLPKVDPQRLGVSSSRYHAAQQACAHLLPHGGQVGQAQSRRDLRAMLGFARCMRSHGVPTWPDPTYDPAAGWGFNLVHVQGFDPNSPQVDLKMSECSRQLPAGIGVPLARPGRPG